MILYWNKNTYRPLFHRNGRGSPWKRPSPDRDPLMDRDPILERDPPWTETPAPLWTDKCFWKHYLPQLHLRAVIIYNNRQSPTSQTECMWHVVQVEASVTKISLGLTPNIHASKLTVLNETAQHWVSRCPHSNTSKDTVGGRGGGSGLKSKV